jgi:hypothetical protein
MTEERRKEGRRDGGKEGERKKRERTKKKREGKGRGKGREWGKRREGKGGEDAYVPGSDHSYFLKPYYLHFMFEASSIRGTSMASCGCQHHTESYK